MDSYRYRGLERQEVPPFVPERRRRALEIGCGEGRFIGSLIGLEESWGIEPSDAADIARTRLTQVYRATFDDVESRLPLSYFDLIICNDVIEHLPDHSSFFSTIGKHLTPDGTIIGSTPNVRLYNNFFEYLLEKDWNYRDWGVLDRTHLAFFTRKSFQRALEQHGFSVLRLEGINTDFRCSNSLRAWTYLIAARALVVVTFGYFSDIRHLQFAFQAIPKRACEQLPLQL